LSRDQVVDEMNLLAAREGMREAISNEETIPERK
jgi:hypothetical protein